MTDRSDDTRGEVLPFPRVHLPSFLSGVSETDPTPAPADSPTDGQSPAPDGGLPHVPAPAEMAPPLHLTMPSFRAADDEGGEGVFVPPAPADPDHPSAADAAAAALAIMTALGIAGAQSMWQTAAVLRARAAHKRALAERAQAKKNATHSTSLGGTGTRGAKGSSGSGSSRGSSGGPLLGSGGSKRKAAFDGRTSGSDGRNSTSTGRKPKGSGDSSNGSKQWSWKGRKSQDANPADSAKSGGKSGSKSGSKNGSAADGSKGPQRSGSADGSTGKGDAPAEKKRWWRRWRRRNKNSRDTPTTDSTETTDSTGSTETTDPTTTTEPTNPTDAAAPTETDTADSTETTDPAETTETADPPETTSSTEATDPTTATEPTNPTDAAAPAEADTTDSTETTEATESTAAADQTETEAESSQQRRSVNEDDVKEAYRDGYEEGYRERAKEAAPPPPPGFSRMRPPPAADQSVRITVERIDADPPQRPGPAAIAPARPALPAVQSEGAPVSTPVKATQYRDAELTIYDVIEADEDMASEITDGITEATAAAADCDRLFSRLEELHAQIVELQVPGVLEGMVLSLMEMTGTVKARALSIAEKLPAAAEAISVAGTNAATRHQGLADAVKDAGHMRPAERDYHDE